ncbi:hypothetical protein [Evansella tamaricis]|uniref:Uncharacterized protein n=1 Tax=Evansella tamaricis TaxID=2069301 RepID=A0ABS6JMX8_9BACI|nr:hypothetical protein [Evansella tamaricis]MBU9714941.1 hypothetical protein [Evansella tamaricis]
MKLDIEKLPAEEQKVYAMMEHLHVFEKKALWNLIQRSNKDHVSMCPKINNEIRSLEQRGLIAINPYYNGPEYSFFVLQNAPYLMRKLRLYSPKEVYEPSWKQRAKKLFSR